MKTNVLKCLAFIAIILLSVPSFGQDYLKIYFHNGTTERHYLSLVQKISATKYDADGILHSDYQMQQIVMADTTYSYPIAEIDSMTYRKVEEEEVEKNFVNATESIAKIYDKCLNVDEMSEYLPQIQQMESVDSAWCTGSAIVVQVKDGVKIFYDYYKAPDDLQPELSIHRRVSDNVSSKLKSENGINKSVHVVIANAQSHEMEDARIRQRNYMDNLVSAFDDLGFSVVLDENPDFDFFFNRMYGYDVIYLSAHGNMDDDVHYILTAQEYYDANGTKSIVAESAIRKYNLDIDDYAFGNASYHVANNPNGIKQILYAISETALQKNKKGFSGSADRKFFFNIACKSLKGSNRLTEHINRSLTSTVSGNRSLADVLIRQGIDVYLGYNENNYFGQYAGYQFYSYLLQGFSEAIAFDNISPDYRSEPTPENAHLIDIPRIESIRNTFLTKVVTQSADENSAYDQAKMTLALTAYTTLSNPDNTNVIAGFYYSPNMKDLMSGNHSYTGTCQISFADNENGNASFSTSINLEPGSTVYYRAYTFDGHYYNLGNICSFTASEPVTAPHIEVSRLDVDFGQIVIGKTGMETFTVSNTGNAQLSYLMQCDVEGSPFYMPDGWQSFILGPGESKEHTIYFKPYSESGAVYYFDIVSDADNNGEQHMYVHGTGVEENHNQDLTGWDFVTKATAFRNLWGSTCQVSLYKKTDDNGITYIRASKDGGFWNYGEDLVFTIKGEYPSSSIPTEIVDYSWKTEDGNVSVDVPMQSTGWVDKNGNLIYVSGCYEYWQYIDNQDYGGQDNFYKKYSKYLRSYANSYTRVHRLNVYYFTDGYYYNHDPYELVIVENDWVDDGDPIVDLELPSGTIWAAWNVGANSPEEYGAYYAWGETKEKENYSQDNYSFYDSTLKSRALRP